MPDHVVRLYDVDARSVVPNTVGNTFTWTLTDPTGWARITDNEPGIEGQTLDSNAGAGGNDQALADVYVNGASSTGADVGARRVWTVRDTVTGTEFEVAQFRVSSGGATGNYTLSEQPLIAGRLYEVVAYQNNPDVTLGEIAITYADYSGEAHVVEGTGGDDVIDTAYTGDPQYDRIDDGFAGGADGNDNTVLAGAGNDSVAAGLGDDTVSGGTGNDTILGEAGNDSLSGDAGADSILGGAGDDTVLGGTGNDTIQGDQATTPVSATEFLDWSAEGPDNSDISAGFTQNTGGVDVSVSFTDDGNNNPTFQVESSLNGYVAPGESFDPSSMLRLFGNGDAATSTATIDFAGAPGSGISGEVENVSFRINDVDWASGNHQDVVTVNAFDANGNPVAVTITPAGADTVSGNTVTAAQTSESQADAEGSVLYQIAGPVSQITISYSNLLTGTHAVYVSDLFFDTIPDPVGYGSDSLDGGDGDDLILGQGGDDTIQGGSGADTIDGGIGADLIHGDTAGAPSASAPGADVIAGGDGNDTILGEAGDDTITGDAGNDSLDGGTGADSIDGGAGDDIAAGGAGADTILGGAGNDTVDGGADADSIQGGQGDDSLTGGDGDDTIIGNDGVGPTTTREGLDWSQIGPDGTNVAGGVTQTTGVMEVSATFTDDGNNNPTFLIESTDTQYVESGEEYDPNSSLRLYGNGDGATSTTTLDFAAAPGQPYLDAVENVTFRINDIDFGSGNHQDFLTINAFDADGNPVPVTITPAGDDTVSGNTVTAGPAAATPADASGSVEVQIAGPVSQVTISYANLLTGTQAIWVSDVYFDTIPDPTAGDADIIDGGAGADSILGDSGNDTITGAAGNDTISGGTGDDTFVLTDGLGADVITDFDISDSDGDGFYNDQFDPSLLTDSSGNPVNAWDVVTTDDGFGNALLTFPNGETVLLQGVSPSAVTGAQLLRRAGIPCFTEGTLIRTPRGEVPVESLKPGDLVLTMDNGAQEIQWIGTRNLGPRELDAAPEHKPILIPQGVLGNHAPLLVSPQHGMLLDRAEADGGPVLVRAKHLAEAPGPVRVAQGKKHVTYIHLMFAAHQVIWANGAPTESFYPGPCALQMFPAQVVDELRALVPGLTRRPVAECYGPTARPFLNRRQVLAGISLRRCQQRADLLAA